MSDNPSSTPTAAAPAPEQSSVPATAGDQGNATTKIAGGPKEATASASGKDNTTANTGKPSVIEQVKRYIPGLGSKDDPAGGKSGKRARGGKGSVAKKGTTAATSNDIASADDPALATATLESAPDRSELPRDLQASSKPRPTGLNGAALGQAEEATQDDKKFSAAAYVHKRIRANTKKIQKLQSYEAQSTPLNEDQKKSLQQKPVLEAIQKELTEISKQFEVEEADEAKRNDKKKHTDEHKIQQRVAAAVSDQKLNNQNELALLLQFLHLYSLFNPGQSQYAQSAVPPVVSNATPQQHAAVHALFHSLANGPLIGSSVAGGDDAVSQIQALQSGSSKDVIEGVTFADVKQMILDLTAGPAEMGHELPASDAAIPQDANVPSGTADGTDGAPSSLNFMQASELHAPQHHSYASEIPVHPVQTEVGSNAATPGFGNTPAVEKTESVAARNGWEAPPTLTAGSIPTGESWADEPPSGAVKNWADDVEESQPSNPFTTRPDVPSEYQAQTQTQSAAPIVDADGFIQDTRGNRGRGAPRGRGGRGGRGQFRGGERRSDGGEWRRQPSGDGVTGESGERRGSFRGRGGRGGRGGEHRGGEHRGGRGRGRPQGGIPTTAAATAAVQQ